MKATDGMVDPILERIRALESGLKLLEEKSAERESRLSARCGHIEGNEPRIAELEKVASGAIEEARRCMTKIMAGLDRRLEVLEDHNRRFVREPEMVPDTWSDPNV